MPSNDNNVDALRHTLAEAIAVAEYATREAARAWDHVAHIANGMAASVLLPSEEHDVILKESIDAKQIANRIWLALKKP